MIPVAEALARATHALTAALKHRDLHTQLHSERVISISLALGRACGLSERELDYLFISAKLHDIGKVGIDDEILLKPGALTDAERKLIEAHCEIGEDIIKALAFEGSEPISSAVRHHHENFDGTGYPDHMAGEDIPVLSRIVTLADCYDALTETRPYHQAVAHEDAIEFVCEQVAQKFDPYLVDRFVGLAGQHRF
jgi:HD-GYP domain-containing protein (c-di-GMP phosphodiesterase class II)